MLTNGGSYVGYVAGKDNHDATNAVSATTPPPFTLVVEKVDPQLAGCGFSGKGTYAVSNENAVFKVDDPALFGASLSVWR